jgi:hypothetical protein
MKCPVRERQTNTRRSCLQTRAGASAVKTGATAMDDEQAPRVAPPSLLQIA